jgi:hypothetical protein
MRRGWRRRACLRAAETYEAALEALQDHLAKAKSFEGRDEQMERTKKTIALLREEKEQYIRIAGSTKLTEETINAEQESQKE